MAEGLVRLALRIHHVRAARPHAGAMLGVFVGLLVALAVPTVAFADAAGPTDFESTIVAVTPPTEGVRFSIEGGDSFVRVDVEPGHEVLVLGYAPDHEPYLRITADSVEENVRSYATYYNQDRYGRSAIPDLVDTTAAPEWRRVGDGGTWAWHDHRAHWMGDEPPINLEPLDALPDQSIDVLVDGRPVSVVVRTVLQPDPSILPSIVGALLGIQLGAIAMVLGRATSTMTVLVGGIGAIVVGGAEYLSLPAATGPLVTWWLLPAISVGCASVTIAVYARSELVEIGLLALGGVMLLLWTTQRRAVFGAAILPTSLPFWVDRLVSAAAGVIGLFAVVTAGRALARLVTSPEPPSSAAAHAP